MITVIIVSASCWVLCAIFACMLKSTKDYEVGVGSFLLGILFGFMYLVYCAGLPLSKDNITLSVREYPEADGDQTSEIEYCVKCGYPLEDGETKCKFCGNEK